ncbi:MAG: hypothetical protein IPL61_11780 [Myxococcales bacterium]|nr:hypothetical protein [Myxococcales bacterium]
MRRSPCTAVAVVAALASAAGPVRASPADDPATDGAVFAGVTGADPANATTNPAALLRLVPGVHVFTIATGSYERVKVDQRTIDPDTGAVGAGPSLTDAVFGGGVTAGFAVASPRRMVAVLASVRPPDETIDDPAVGYHTRGSRTRRIDWATLAGGFSITSRLYLGLAGTLADRHHVLAFARDTALDAGRDPTRGLGSDCGGAPCGLGDPAARELWRIDVEPSSLPTTDNLMYTVGVLAKLPGGIWLGLAAERPWQLGRFTMTGDVTIVRAPRDGGGTLRGDAVVYQHLPEVIRFGGRGPLTRTWEVTGELRWRRLARVDPVDVRVFGADLAGTDVPELTLRPSGLTDAVAIQAGVEQLDRGQTWRAGARLGLDTGAVSADHLSPRAPWGRQVTAAAGLQVRLARWTLQLGYRVDLQLPTSTGASAFDPLDRIACAEADYDYDLPACATVRAGYGTTTAAGDYSRQTHTLRLALGFVLP